MSDINVGAITEALNDKMDRDGHNVQLPSAVIVEKQDPGASNNYTWYRKYSDGWVEMGGSMENVYNNDIIYFPIRMANTRYTVGLFPFATGNFNLGYNTPTTTSVTVYTSYNGAWFSWQVSGMAAS